jgi:hypothetical protein
MRSSASGGRLSVVAGYRIHEDESAVTVELTEVGGDQAQLLEAFSKCRAGQCSCPTDEYRKLAELDVQSTEDVIRLQLKTKPGEKLDISEIEACLDYTTGKAAGTKPAR